MSNDQPPPAGPGGPEDDPFRKPPPEAAPPGGQGPPPGQPPPPPGGGGGPYGPGAGSPYGPGGGAYGSSGGGMPPYDSGAYGGGPYGGEGRDPLAGMPPLADFGKRLAARIIDALIVFVPLFLISLPFGWGDGSGGDGWDDIASDVNTGRQWLWSLIAMVAYVGYDTLMVKRNGQTVGKRLLKIRVALLNDGSTPDTRSALLRAAVLWVPALLCCLCVWWLVVIITIVADKPYKQGLHDKAGRTVVVTVPQ